MAQPAVIQGGCTGCAGQLTVNEVDLNNGFAWCVMDLSDIYKRALRGGDILIPGAAGVLPQARRRAPVEMQFPLVVVGAFDQFGVEAVDPAIQLQHNLEFLNTTLAEDGGLDPATGTFPAVYTAPDGTVYSADVHPVPPLDIRLRGGHSARAVLTLNVPDGWFS